MVYVSDPDNSSSDLHGITRANLSSYKRALAERFRIVRFLNEKHDISHRFFPLEVSSLDADSRKTPRLDAIGVLTTKRNPRICLLGQSGAGKTAIIRRLTWQMQKVQEVPFVLLLRRHLERTHNAEVPLSKWFSDFAGNLADTPNARARLEHEIMRRQGVFIIDGFDELSADPEWARAVAETVESYFSGKDRCRVIVTSRTRQDLFGHFDGYKFFKLEPVRHDNAEAFLQDVGVASSRSGSLLSQLGKNILPDFRPIMLLIAAAYDRQYGAAEKPPSYANVDSTFKLLALTINRILRDVERDDYASGRILGLTADDVQQIRITLLETIVKNWQSSAKPCQVSEGLLVLYLRNIVSTYASGLDGRSNLVTENLQYIVPTGLCLDKISSGDGFSYVFLHNSIQEYFFAKLLLFAIANEDTDLVKREYYSVEILELLGEELPNHDIYTLLRWACAKDVDPMLRKVSVSALGFVKGPTRPPDLVERLQDAFRSEEDIGVAGRMAEALRRLGHVIATESFIHNLANYSPERRRSSNPSRPLTHEIDQPLEGFDDQLDKLIQTLAHPDAAIRKHALILLLRQTHSLPRNVLVRYCLYECRALIGELNSSSPQQPRVNELIRSLRYGVEALGRFGCEVEVEFAVSLLGRLSQSEVSGVNLTLQDHLNELPDRIGKRAWFARFENVSDEVKDASVFLIRHGESDGNRDNRLLGSRSDGILTELGVRQSKQLVSFLRKHLTTLGMDEIVLVTSPLERCKATARSIKAEFRCMIYEEQLLMELDFGKWSNRTIQDLESNSKNAFAKWVADKWMNPPPEGESLFEVRSRACQAIAKWLEPSIAKRRPLVVVTHCFPIMAVSSMFQSSALVEPNNGSITSFVRTGGQWAPVLLNETHFLRQSEWDEM